MKKIKSLSKTDDGNVYTLWDTPDGEFELLYTYGMMDLLAADLGDDLPIYQSTLDEVAATYVPPDPIPEPTQFEKDQARYQKRAAVRDSLIAYMAADNMSRVRSGVWTVADLTNLLSDPSVSAANQYMSTLSYELAAVAIQNATTPILTPEIKSDWVARLTEHFYL